jgi:hypothetical protein
MTSTTQLRVLRTSLRAPPSQLLLLRFSYRYLHNQPAAATTSQRIQNRTLQPPQCPPRHFSTSPHPRQQSQRATTHLAEAAAERADRGAAVYAAPPQSTTSPTAANPPASTRPPPLHLPARDPSASTFSHLFATGKAYLTFYKTGFKQIYINTRLVWSLGSASGIPPEGDNVATAGTAAASPPTLRPAATTRSAELLKRRWRHDVRRLPLFALMFVVCGELTPLVVLALPGTVPLTCRIPRQIEKLRRTTEARRRASSARIQEHMGGGARATVPSRAGVMITAHVARSLNLVAPLWDHLPDAAVALLASRRVRAHVAYLVRDGHLLSQAGGVPALEDDEVTLACEDRGLPVVDRSAAALREELERWLDLAGGEVGDGSGDTGSPWSPEAVARRETLVVSLLAAPKWPLERQELKALASKIEW